MKFGNFPLTFDAVAVGSVVLAGVAVRMARMEWRLVSFMMEMEAGWR